MNIQGFQKMTLLDFPGHVAATVFTGGCNFRCPFCHNASIVTGPSSPAFSEEEIFQYLSARKKMLDGICITGGEPLLNRDIELFIRKVRDLGLKVKLDSNGSFPDTLEKLTGEGLVDYVAMDIKNCREKYQMTVDVPNFSLENIERSIEILKKGRTDFEFRTTVVDEFHTPDDIEKIGQWLQGDCRYFLQSFKDSGDIIKEGLHAASRERLYEMLEKAKKYLPEAKIRGIE